MNDNATGYTMDGRLRWKERCAYGHSVSATECPSCGEKRGFPETLEAVQWYERRYPKAKVKRRNALDSQGENK